MQRLWLHVAIPVMQTELGRGVSVGLPPAHQAITNHSDILDPLKEPAFDAPSAMPRVTQEEKRDDRENDGRSPGTRFRCTRGCRRRGAWSASFPAQRHQNDDKETECRPESLEDAHGRSGVCFEVGERIRAVLLPVPSVESW